MIRFVVVLTNDRIVETRIDGAITTLTQPTGTILRSGFCSDQMFNRQALAADEAVIEVIAADWPVDDKRVFVDLTGDEPTLVSRTAT